MTTVGLHLPFYGGTDKKTTIVDWSNGRERDKIIG